MSAMAALEPDQPADLSRLQVYRVEVTKESSESFWVLAVDENSAKAEAEEAVEFNIIDMWDEDVSARIVRVRGGPRDGDQVLFEGAERTWPIPDMTDEQRDALAIRQSIHPDQGRLL
jgi:hypothetical protein